MKNNVSTPTEESTDMTTPILTPKLTAEQALSNVLNLIYKIKRVSDITPELLEKTMGTPIVSYDAIDDKYYGFGEQITPEWQYGFIVDKRSEKIFFSFDFYQITKGYYADMTDICGIDFEGFSNELIKKGFTRKHDYAEHGRLLYDYFTHPDYFIRIQVSPRGEANVPHKKVSHRCIERIYIY